MYVNRQRRQDLCKGNGGANPTTSEFTTTTPARAPIYDNIFVFNTH
jgi:hypothetical protein